jgi:hypothetical protein
MERILIELKRIKVVEEDKKIEEKNEFANLRRYLAVR